MPWDIHNNKGKKIGTLYEVHPGPLAILAVLLIIKTVGFSIHLFVWINSLLFPESVLKKDSTVNHEGIGSVKIGMHYKEAEKAARIKLVLVEGNELALWPFGNFSTAGCSYVQPWGFYGIHIMLVDGYIARIDIRNSYTETDKGITHYSSPRSVKGHYGKHSQITTSKKGLKKITYQPPEVPNHRMVFHTHPFSVSRFSVGRLPEIQREENGCSKS